MLPLEPDSCCGKLRIESERVVKVAGFKTGESGVFKASESDSNHFSKVIIFVVVVKMFFLH